MGGGVKQELGLNVLIRNIFCIDYARNIDGTMWYMSFLLLWYIAFFLIFYFNFPIILKIMGLITLGYCFREYSNNIFEACAWQFSINAFAFPIGVTLGYCHELRDVFFSTKRIKIGYRVGIAITCSVIYIYICALQSNRFGLLGIILFFSLYNFIKIICHGKMWLYGLFIGGFSYPMYLSEAKIMDMLSKYVNPKEENILFCVVFLIFLVIFLISYNFSGKVYGKYMEWYSAKQDHIKKAGKE